MEMFEKYKLLNDFAIVPAVAFKKQNVSMPEVPNATEGNLNKAVAQEKHWVDHAMILMEKTELEKKDIIAWSAYHASQKAPCENVFPALA